MMKDIIDKLDKLRPRDGCRSDIHGDAHIDADLLLLEALERLGHKDVCDAFRAASARCGFNYS